MSVALNRCAATNVTHNVNMSRTTVFLVLFIAFSYGSQVSADDFDDDSGTDYWDNFSKNLNKQISGQLRSLNNLGSQITQQVHEGLRPVREMQSRFRVKFGNDGTTIATYKDRQFIVRNGVMYECNNGVISQTDGSCSGTLQKLNFQNKKDYCYANVNSMINNWYCIGNGPVNSGYVNGNVYCNGTDGTPTLLITQDEYNKLCGSQTKSVTYKYFSDKPMGEHGPEMQCTNGTPYVCTMTENNVISVSSRSYVQIN